jgi:hypothetical protein
MLRLNATRWFETAQIRLQRRVFVALSPKDFGTPCNFFPASLDNKQHRSEIITPFDVFRLRALRQGQQFVNLKPLARSRAAKKSIRRRRSLSASSGVRGQAKCANRKMIAMQKRRANSSGSPSAQFRYDCSTNAPTIVLNSIRIKSHLPKTFSADLRNSSALCTSAPRRTRSRRGSRHRPEIKDRHHSLASADWMLTPCLKHIRSEARRAVEHRRHFLRRRILRQFVFVCDIADHDRGLMNGGA